MAPARGRGLFRLAVAAVVVLGALPALAQERSLTERHPVRLGDAFPIGLGEGALMSAGSVAVPRVGAPRGVFPLDLEYNPLPRTQIGLGTELTTDGSDQSGDLVLSGRFNFDPPTGPLVPTFATQLAITVPTGRDSRAVDLELTGYASRDVFVGPFQVYLHLNASVDVRASALGDDERRAVYHLVAGPSFTVPSLAQLTLVGDVFVDQARRRGEPETVGLEVGARYRLTPSLVLDTAVGTEVAGPRDRTAFFALVGVTWSFTTRQAR